MPISTDLEAIPDEQLLTSVRKLVAKSNLALAELLAHLGEVEARGLHRSRACASLYTYCVYELRMSEDAAFRRAKAARFVRRFPELFDRIAKGELHLTGLLMLGPHLDCPERAEILERARFRSKREIEKLVARIDPKPPVPGLVVPLGPAPARTTSDLPPGSVLGWPVRELPDGDRPADWIENEVDDPGEADQAGPHGAAVEGNGATGEATSEPGDLRPIRFKVQFTATQEYVDTMNEALDFLSHEMRTRDVAELHARAMKALVAELRKKKCAETDRPRAKSAPLEDATVQSRPEAESRNEPAESRPAPAEPPPAGDDVAPLSAAPARQTARQAARAKRTRYIAAAVRREVWDRDGGRCAYVDAEGRRCAETARLDVHHKFPHAKGGEQDAENLELRCRPHNDLAAEQDFGREHMARMRGELT
jgi:hypothetical protein